jgi:snf2 family protein
MYPPYEAIKLFISKKARANSIKKASQYTSKLIDEDENTATFSCRGSYGENYEQIITFNDKKPLSVTCTCPYDHGGICKHAVSALRQLEIMSNYANGRIRNFTTPVFSAEKAPAPPLHYPLAINEWIDFTTIVKDFNEHDINTRDDRGAVRSFVPGIWEININDFHSWGNNPYHVKLQKNSTENTLELSCNCNKKQYKQYCSHQLQAINFARKYLGEDCLSNDYREHKIAEFLEAYNLTLEDDYQVFFDFTMTEQGLTAKCKIPDLLPADFTLARPAVVHENLIEKAEKKYGLALVFNIDPDNDTIYDINLLVGKYNKKGELATSFREVNPYNFEEILLADGLPPKTQEIWAIARRLSRHYETFLEQEKEEAATDMVGIFNQLLEKFPDLPLFTHTAAKYHMAYSRRNLMPVAISAEKVGLEYHFKDDGLVYRMESRIKIGQKSYLPQTLDSEITPFCIYHNHEFVLYPDAQTAFDVLRSVVQPSMAVIKKNAAQLQSMILSPLSERYAIKSKDFIEHKNPSAEDLSFTRQVYVSEQDGAVLFRPAAQYADQLIPVHSQALRLHLDEKGRFHYNKRNKKAEQDFLSVFESLHPNFQHAQGAYVLAPEQLVENFWFIDFAACLKEMDIALLGAQELKSFQYNLHKPNLSVRVESGIDWFDVNIEISYGDQIVSLKDVQKAFLKKQNYIELNDGSIGMLPEEWVNRFAHYFKAGEIKKNGLRISNFQFGIIDELYESLENKPEFLIDLYQRKQRLQHLTVQPDIKLAKGLKATLRPYQQHGLNWLAFLHENRLGGCLADDMGLGKTLQTIAFLHYLKTAQQSDRPSLIVAPTSLVFNWQAEIMRFCPSLKLLDFTGQGRQQYIDRFAHYDVVLTTYGTLTQDIETLKGYAFNYVVLDESQAIKNPQSQRYKAVRLLQAYNRLILTGTPIENNTFDLYAQFNFLNPGLLGSNTHFKKEFSNAVDKNKDTAAAALLAKIVNPFILRRTKEQVATELPPKTESVIYCEMDKAQRKVYETVKKKYRDYLLSKISENGINKSQMYILEGLTRLRQICNSPALLDDADYGDESVKLDTLLENIKEKTGNHKILVFSSFVKMLALIEARLQEEQIPYEYLDGQTRDRQARVDSFQGNDEIRVFLISTKAGGTGLNLTEADYVFIVDPWWNPAVENQAIDRSHRIGQNKHVMAYRMICRDSIEEKILALQERKRGIAESIISVDDEKKSFDLDEVKSLFA